MVSNVSRRLGFNYDIDREDLRSMYDMCRYNKAWEVAKISPWCAVSFILHLHFSRGSHVRKHKCTIQVYCTYLQQSLLGNMRRVV